MITTDNANKNSKYAATKKTQRIFHIINIFLLVFKGMPSNTARRTVTKVGSQKASLNHSAKLIFF